MNSEADKYFRETLKAILQETGIPMPADRLERESHAPASRKAWDTSRHAWMDALKKKPSR